MSARDEQLQQAATDLVGKTVDRWRLESLLGVGGWAAVYAARHRNGNRVALKLLHPRMAADPASKKRFLREGYVANKLDHPGVPKVLDDGVTSDGRVYLAMELLTGESISDRVFRQGPLSDVETLQLTHQLLDVLERAHRKQILHRDIKPSNLFLSVSGKLHVVDFGVARMKGSGGAHMTATGHLLGTPAYMPPEQARGRWDEVDARSDLWSVGAAMFWMLTGRSVHDAETANEVLLSAMTKAPPLLRDVSSDVADVVADIVDRALQRDPAARWQKASEMKAAVAGAYAARTSRPISKAMPLIVPAIAVQEQSAMPPPTVQATMGSFAKTLTGARRGRLGAVAVALAAVAGTAAILWTLSPGERRQWAQGALTDDIDRIAGESIDAISVPGSASEAETTTVPDSKPTASASPSATATPRPYGRRPFRTPPSKPTKRKGDWLDQYE